MLCEVHEIYNIIVLYYYILYCVWSGGCSAYIYALVFVQRDNDCRWLSFLYLAYRSPKDIFLVKNTDKSRVSPISTLKQISRKALYMQLSRIGGFKYICGGGGLDVTPTHQLYLYKILYVGFFLSDFMKRTTTGKGKYLAWKSRI